MTKGKMKIPLKAEDKAISIGKKAYEKIRRTKKFMRRGAKSELWIQLVEARYMAGLTQAEMANRLGSRRLRYPELSSEDMMLTQSDTAPVCRGVG